MLHYFVAIDYDYTSQELLVTSVKEEKGTTDVDYGTKDQFHPKRERGREREVLPSAAI